MAKFLKLLLCTTLFLLKFASSQRLTVVPISDPSQPFIIASSAYEYGWKNLDVVWNVSFSAEITITEFSIDSEGGEFAVVCEHHLPNDPRFQDGAAADDVVGDFPLENSLLLTTEVLREDLEDASHKRLVIRVANEQGALIYFHGIQNVSFSGAGVSSNLSALNNSNGFFINVTYYDLYPMPETTTTTEAPPQEIYTTQYLIGRTPADLLYNISIARIKQAIADMATEYVSNQTNIALPGPVTEDDIHVTERTMYFCEKTIPNNTFCTKIMFAITTKDEAGAYIMNNTLLNDMWILEEKYFGELRLKRYIPEPQPGPMDTWVWVAAFLGIILVVGALLTALITSASTGKPLWTNSAAKRPRSPSVDLQTRSGSGSGGGAADAKHPLVEFATKIVKQREQNRVVDLGLAGRDPSSYGGSSSSRTNPLAGFDNSAFEDEDSDPRPSYSGSRPRSRSNARSPPMGSALDAPKISTIPPFRDSDSEEEIEIRTGLTIT